MNRGKWLLSLKPAVANNILFSLYKALDPEGVAIIFNTLEDIPEEVMEKTKKDAFKEVDSK